MENPHAKGVASHSAPSLALYAARPAVKRKQGKRVSLGLRGVR